MTLALSIEAIIEAMLASEWREDDLFQIPVLLYTIPKVDSDRRMLNKASVDPEIASKVKRIIAEVLASRPQRRDGETQQYSDYIMFQCCQVFSALQSTSSPIVVVGKTGAGDRSAQHMQLGGLPVSAIPDHALSQIPLALARSAETGFK
jgi:hypothetical protein